MMSSLHNSGIFDPNPDLYPDPDGRADRICRFIERLKLWEGALAGQPFTLHPFQKAIIRRIYGPSDDSGRRLVRTAALWIPRGNAKTTLASGLALAHFMGPENEEGGQIVMAAADRENAGIAFNCANVFVRQDEYLAQRVQGQVSRKTLLHPRTSSFLKAISSDAHTKHGMNVSMFLADELHSWHPAQARDLFNTITDGMVKRENPLSVIISTAGSGLGGIAHELWDYSWRVATGEIEDPSFAPVIFAAPPDADWRDEAAWRDANPAIDAGFLTIDELRTKAKKAEHYPADIANFKRFHLNQWQEGAAEPWVDIKQYDLASPRRERSELVGEECFVGIDLSSVHDLTAVVTVFTEEIDGELHYDVFAQFFLPEENISAKSDADEANYLKWVEEGILTLTPGNCIDYRALLEHVEGLAKEFAIREIPIDRWNSKKITPELQEMDLEVIEFGQGFASMSGPVKELKAAILSRRFRHGGNGALRMNFANLAVEIDTTENEKFTKAKSRGRIDGAVAAVMAIGRAIENVDETSPYEDQDLLVI